MEYVPPRSKPMMIPKRPVGNPGRVLKVALEPIQISLMKGDQPATDTPATLPIRYAQPM